MFLVHVRELVELERVNYFGFGAIGGSMRRHTLYPPVFVVGLVPACFHTEGLMIRMEIEGEPVRSGEYVGKFRSHGADLMLDEFSVDLLIENLLEPLINSAGRTFFILRSSTGTATLMARPALPSNQVKI